MGLDWAANRGRGVGAPSVEGCFRGFHGQNMAFGLYKEYGTCNAMGLVQRRNLSNKSTEGFESSNPKP